jgi:hypothetical protein
LKHSLCAVIHYFQPDARRVAKNGAVLMGAKIAFDLKTVSTAGKLAGSDFLSFRFYCGEAHTKPKRETSS